MTTRREFLSQASLAVSGVAVLGTAPAWVSQAQADSLSMLTRKIPSSGEAIPVIGMGTSGSFQVSANGPEYQALREVLKRFFAGGATLIDTAPTYGNAEDVLGPLLKESGARKQ